MALDTLSISLLNMYSLSVGLHSLTSLAIAVKYPINVSGINLTIANKNLVW